MGYSLLIYELTQYLELKLNLWEMRICINVASVKYNGIFLKHIFLYLLNLCWHVEFKQILLSYPQIVKEILKISDKRGDLQGYGVIEL